MSEDLKTKAERLFCPQYLCDPARSSWRDMVCPANTTPPPTIRLSTLLGFVEISAACDGDVQRLADALRSSSVVQLSQVADSAGKKEWWIRRREALKPDENPEKRTVFVKPIHYGATTDEVRTFFERFGPVEAVERRTFLDGGVMKPRPSVFVVFATQDAANKCLRSKPGHGTCGDPLGDHWLPKLTVGLKADFEAQIAEESERQFEKQQRAAVVQAQRGAAGADSAANTTVSKRLRPGCTCKVSGLAANAKWQDIKAFVGELSKAIELVHVVGDGCAFVVCKSPKDATDCIVNYQDLERHLKKTTPNPDEKKIKAHAERFRSAVPALALLEGTEEEAVIRQYPTWASAKVQKKQAINEKHPAAKADHTARAAKRGRQ